MLVSWIQLYRNVYLEHSINYHDALWESKNQLKKDKENTSLHNTCVQEWNCMAGHGTFVH